MRVIWFASLMIPLSFWNQFNDAFPRLICETPYWVHHRAVVTPKQFAPDELVAIGRAFTGACGEVPLCVLYMAPRYDTASSYVLSGWNGNLDNWLHRVELFIREDPEPIKDVAQVNVVNGEAVLRLRRDGKVSRFVLTENDPLKYTIGEQEFEVLEIYGDLMGTNVETEYLDGGALAISRCSDCVPYFDISVRTDGELSMSTFRELVRRLAAIDVPVDLRVSLRQDTWFVPTRIFPMLYAFDEAPPRVPTKEEYLAAGELGALVRRSRNAARFSEYDGTARKDLGWESLDR